MNIKIIEVEVEIKLGVDIIQRQHSQIPNILIKQYCSQLVMQAINDSRPMEIKFTTKEPMDMSKYNQPDKYAINTLVFSNNSYIKAFPKEFE